MTDADQKTITLDALKGAIFSVTDENGFAQDLGDAIWNRL